MYHFRARVYDAIIGRFCCRDTEGYADGLNLYRSYFAIGFTDPLGQRRREPRGSGRKVCCSYKRWGTVWSETQTVHTGQSARDFCYFRRWSFSTLMSSREGSCNNAGRSTGPSLGGFGDAYAQHGKCVVNCMLHINKQIGAGVVGVGSSIIYVAGQYPVAAPASSSISGSPVLSTHLITRFNRIIKTEVLFRGKLYDWYGKGCISRGIAQESWIKHQAFKNLSKLQYRRWVLRRGVQVGAKYFAVAELHLLNYCVWKCGVNGF